MLRQDTNACLKKDRTMDESLLATLFKEIRTTVQKFPLQTESMKPEKILPADYLVTTKFKDQALKTVAPV